MEEIQEQTKQPESQKQQEPQQDQQNIQQPQQQIVEQQQDLQEKVSHKNLETLKSEIKMGKVHHFHFFVNSISGGQSGKKFLQIPDNKLSMELEDNKTGTKHNCELYFHDLCTKEHRDKGLQQLNIQQRNNKKGDKFYSIVAGGDGTVLWVVDEMVQAGCNMEEIVVGTIAIGTGNDFSRATGWGGEEAIGNLLQNKYAKLKKLVLQWAISSVSYFDLWDFTFDVYDGGYFIQVKKGEDGKPTKQILVDQNKQNLRTFTKTMSNYFSIGIDARIGFGFDKRRTESRSKNKCIYCLEGVKKLFLSNKKIPETLESVVVVQNESPEINQQLNDQNLKSSQEKQLISDNLQSNKKQQSNENVLFTTSKQNLQSNQKIMMDNPISLVILNINSYGAGIHGIWKNSGTKVVKQKNDKTKKYQIPEEHKNFQQQSFGDKKLEMVSFSTLLNISNERLFGGNANKIAQGQGPFVFYYKQYQSTKGDKGKQLFQTYFQIDGEYFAVMGAKQIRVESSKKVPNGQIKILVNKQNYAQLKSNGALMTESKVQLNKQQQQPQQQQSNNKKD